MGIVLIQAAEMRLEGADVVLLNVRPADVENLRTFADLRALRARLGDRNLFVSRRILSSFLGHRSASGCFGRSDCFDGIEICSFP